MDREANRHRNMSKVYNGTNQITSIVCWRTHTRVSCLPPVFSNLSVPFFTASNHEKKRKKNSSQTEVIYLVPLAAEIWPLRIFLIIFKICHVIYQSIWNFTMISKMYTFIPLWFDAVKKTIQLNLKILGANRTSYYRKIPEEGDRKKPHKAKEIDNFYSRNC